MPFQTRLRLLTLLLIGSSQISAPAFAQSVASTPVVVSGWDFQGTAATTGTPLVTAAPASDLGSVTGHASSLGMTNAFTSPASTDGSNIEGADPGSSDTAATNFAWRIVGSGSPGGNGWSSASPVGSQGAQFLVSTVGYASIKLQFDLEATTQGESNVEVLYTLDGSTWTNTVVTAAGVPVPDTGGTTASATVKTNSTSANTVAGTYVQTRSNKGAWFPKIAADFSSIPGAANNPNFGVRIVNASTGADCLNQTGAALNNTSGNWRLDEVQITGVPAFTSGNLIVSRGVYQDVNATVSGGIVLGAAALQPGVNLPDSSSGVTPFVAIASGAYPDVFNNDTVDTDFGVTAPAYLDEVTTSGALVFSLPVPTSLMVTSFSSKSEMALNLSSDGQYLTFMGYATSPGSIDVSNSNTPAIDEPGNYVTAPATFREVVQVDPEGNFQATTTNAYSGNNGRAAILADGLYFTVGNAGAGNGSAQITAATGVQIVSPGQAASASTPGTQPVGSYSITENGYAADKTPKDNNFRGETVFNNTLYVSKGSGGSGINTVYQVGAAGTLPSLSSAGTTAITVLPGFPTVLSSAGTGVSHPFGLWFANANTLYVADEGDGTTANLTTDPNSGLEKWVLKNGTWSLAYTLKSGLNIGQYYTVSDGLGDSYFATAPDGLRNLTGSVNGNGTVTIYATSSTVSASGDEGADPNQLVTITDTLSFTTPAQAASESFSVLRSAQYGEVLRGVAFAPVTAALSAPTIASQPLGASVPVGSSVTLSVGASGNPSPTFQWFFDSSAIGGATSSTLALGDIQTSSGGTYSVLVSNSQGSLGSNPVVVSVFEPSLPSVTSPAVNQTVTTGSYASFSVTAAGTPAPTFQWEFNGTAISGATSSVLGLGAVQPSSAGAYAVVLTNSAGSITFAAGSLAVNTPSLGTVISGWDFQNLPIATNLTPASDLGAVSGSASTLGMNNSYGTPGASTDISDIEGGAGGDTGSSDPAGFANQAWRVRGGPAVTGQTANGWSSLAPIGSQGAQFNVSTVGYAGIKLRFDVETTSKAEGNLEVLYTVDGATWVNTPISITTTPAAGNTATALTNTASANTVQGAYINLAGSGTWFNGIVADLSAIPGAANNPNFAVRIVNASTGADCVNQSGAAYNNSSGNWRFDEVQVLGLSASPAVPVITQSPTGVSAPIGSGVSLTASGTSPLTYQWYFDGSPIAGATSSSLTVPSPQQADAGSYTVVVTNAAGSTVSTSAALGVH